MPEGFADLTNCPNTNQNRIKIARPAAQTYSDRTKAKPGIRTIRDKCR